MNDADKLELLRILEELYPNPKSELNFKNNYQLLICVMLSAQCTDKKVNEVAPYLFKRWSSFSKLSQAKLKELETVIRPINYYRTKAKHLIGTAARISEHNRGRLPRTMEGLTALPGVGRKTASVILSELNIEPAFPVDTHVFRLALRLGLAAGQNRDRVEEQLKAQFRPQVWRNLHHWLIFHGRRTCKAQNPLCRRCRIAGLCPSCTN